jgi:IS1 family transposase
VALRPKKQRKLWIWLAYSRAKKRIIACEIGSRGDKPLKRLWAKVRTHSPFAVCTDKWKVYPKVIPANLLIQSKKYTHNIEAQNSSLRDSIKRYNRKTKAYSKSQEMAELAVYIHFFYKYMIG